MRYVNGRLVLRLHVEPSNKFVEQLNNEFKDILESGIITKVDAHELEMDDEHLADLPRISLLFNRKNLGRLRQMIDRIFEFSETVVEGCGVDMAKLDTKNTSGPGLLSINPTTSENMGSSVLGYQRLRRLMLGSWMNDLMNS